MQLELIIKNYSPVYFFCIIGHLHAMDVRRKWDVKLRKEIKIKKQIYKSRAPIYLEDTKHIGQP